MHTLVSCPAKVLIGGGYLVLDPAYTGTVVATSSRFYAYFDAKFTHEAYPNALEGDSASMEDQNTHSEKLLLVFRSPQFVDAEWTYLITRTTRQDTNHSFIAVRQMSDKKGLTARNPFVEVAILESFRLGFALNGSLGFEVLHGTSHVTNGSLPMGTIVLLADNDFYSQPRDQSNPLPFNALGVPIAEVHKTGLGSSAAMVTSVCGALLLRIAPNLLVDQVSAQGKIGSGFDISAAVWGTHVYRRFSEDCLLASSASGVEGSAAELLALLDPKMNPLWTNDDTAPRVKPFALPPLTTLMLADVDAGSHTPSMVGKVLSWRKANTDEANSLWDNISILNERLGELCIKLNEMFNTDKLEYTATVSQLSHHSNIGEIGGCKPVSEKDDTKALFLNLRATMQQTRKLMRCMGEASDVPIEPPSQTELLDKCDELAGVVGSGVPGAGGYDAIWVLVYSPETASLIGAANVVKLWNDWSNVSVRALSKDACVAGGTLIRPTGIRLETMKEVKGLEDVLSGKRRMSTVAIPN
ncbi:uncharacterized protein MELLADRAFT_87033 [Melampsora larici-populina 98AG31]|uniref:Phosphomevalonate kinase n=1 Tax=Melampsora larici-populina (strain 98AG31 / pathotype 3-4-7) TaxID=747676 RepID=F4R499_MELLP|nr:uncharacterized protein MELLADRAFT_87033 [Melampsora larici-populina 98AG31]EGG13035.1 hypothetical protein MELLADRAFT_87033 [Melampsora larici-populina 98AG31]